MEIPPLCGIWNAAQRGIIDKWLRKARGKWQPGHLIKVVASQPPKTRMTINPRRISIKWPIDECFTEPASRFFSELSFVSIFFLYKVFINTYRMNIQMNIIPMLLKIIERRNGGKETAQI
jgi:hypothetical protein